jgi:hypothetical protein
MTKKVSSTHRRVCKLGHVYFKSSDCPVCPVCEAANTTKNSFLSLLAAPARRALENNGIKTPVQLSKKTEAEILKLHGMGPATMPILRNILSSNKLSFKK